MSYFTYLSLNYFIQYGNLGSSMLLQMTLSQTFYGCIIVHCA